MHFVVKKNNNLGQNGYTLPEMLVTLIMTALFVALIMTFTFSYWRYGASQEADLDTLTTRLNAGDILREYLTQSSGLITQNSLPDSHVLNPDPLVTNGLHWQPLHAIPGNYSVANGTKPLLYFRRFTQNTTGNFILNGTQPYEDEYVIYLNAAKKQMLLRTLANQAAGNKIASSCPPSQATQACSADKVIASDIESVDLRYFSRAGNLLDYTSITDPDLPGTYIGPDFPVVEVVELTLNLSKKPFLNQTNSTKNSTIIRIALRNT